MNQSLNILEAEISIEKKIHLIAEEVFSILKELSGENKEKINSKSIAEKMLWKEEVKDLLTCDINVPTKSCMSNTKTIGLPHVFMDKLIEDLPVSISERLIEAKENLPQQATDNNPEWLDQPVEIIKNHFNSIAYRNSELEEFIKQTFKHLGSTEGYLSNESSIRKLNFQENKEFEDTISSNIQSIEECYETFNDISTIKAAVSQKIDTINNVIKSKREQDTLKLEQSEKSLEEMYSQMKAIKQEADDLRRRAQEIEAESFRDKLTGLYNRKAYDEKVIETIAYQNRYNVPAALLVCDIDFFKKINDNFGHNVGDLALKKIAAYLTQRLRANNFISRYGGEEFTIILPHTDLNGALTAGENIRSYISDLKFSHKKEDVPLTISIGISTFRKDDNSNTVFDRADQALYLAKRSGRDNVKTENDLSSEDTVQDVKPLVR